jgi:hypothetical protein
MRRLAALAATAAALALSGCGGSSLSNTQLHVRASQICSLANVRTNGIPTPSSPAGTEEFLERGAAALTPALTGLRALHPPEDVADVYSAAVGNLAQKIHKLQLAAHDISRGVDPVRAMRDLQRQLSPLETQENDGWDALELPACMSR